MVPKPVTRLTIWGAMFPSFTSTLNPSEVAVEIPVWLDLMAVVIGSFSGLLYAQVHRLDLVGHMGLAIICGLGGGLIRDTIMQVGDVYMINSPWAIWVSIATACVGFLFPSLVTRFPHLLEWVDILTVALFSAAGTDKAIVYDLGLGPTLLMGTMTGVGGGMLRDIVLGEVPGIFQQSNLYATCAIAGSITYWCSVELAEINKTWAILLCMLVTVGLRRWSLRNDVYSPADVNLAPKVKGLLRHRKK